MENKKDALVPVAPSSPASMLLYDPAALDQALTLAEKLGKSKLVPEALQNSPADILVTIMAGHELGLSPMQALRGIHVVEGRPYMSADLIVALVLARRDVCEYFRCVETTDQRATYVTKRRGQEEQALTFTIEEAKRAGLLDRGRDPSRNNWNRYPAAMLRARASKALAQMVYQDILFGVGELDELHEVREAIDITPQTVAPPPPPTKAPAPSSPQEPAAAGAEATSSEPDPQALYKEWAARISAVPNESPDALSELGAMTTQIAQLPDDVKDALREVYVMKVKAVKRAQRKTEDPSGGAIS